MTDSPRQTDVTLHEQREWLRVTLSSIGDGVITTDGNGAVTFLNPVAQSLTGWTPADAAGKPLIDVFKIVNEESRRTVENPVARALREGVVVGLANHTLLIARDGTERPIDDSAAPIRDEQGRVAGCVLVFRDISERRRAERIAEDALHYAESIVDTVREPMLILDAQLRVVTVSRAVCRMFHVTPEETQGQFIYDLGNGQWNIPALRTLLEDVLPQNTTFNDYEVEHDFPGIGHRVMLLNARRIYREGIHTELVLLAIEDISDRNRAEAAVKVSEVRYRRLFETAKDGILILDADTAKITDANPYIGELLGYSHDELIGKELWEIGLFKDVDENKAAVRELHEKHYLRYEDLPLETKAGRKADVEFVSNVYGENSHQVIQCNIRDITERKRLLDVERKGEQRMRLVIDSMPQKTFTATPTGEIDYFSPQWTEFTGLSFEQIEGWGWKQFMHPDDLGETVRLWTHSLATGEAYHQEHRFRRADGEYRWHLSRGVPLRDDEGEVVMWVGSNTDIHEQKQTASQLRQFAADLSEADNRKNEFLAMLAHELRNPLAPIRNALQILRLTKSGGEAVQSASMMMERQMGQMVRLVDDLLDVSRISRGKIELKRGRVELASVVHQAVEAARSLSACADLELAVTLPSQPIYLNADPTRLAQVVGNLLNNACKFTDKGGRISLTGEREGQQAVIRVRDTGIGIAADQLPRIFDMFMQVDSSLERSTSGLGIGLSLVKNLVEMHDGTVEVRSAGVGEGTEFVVCLPIMIEPPQPPPPEPTASEPTPATARRILVVDDNRDSAESLSQLLDIIGHETHTAFDGLEAVEAAATFRPDVVLCDIGLPKLNGYEVARKIRGQPWGKEMVLVAVTGWGQDEDRHKPSEAGFNGHLVKPVDFASLTKLLAELQAATV